MTKFLSTKGKSQIQWIILWGTCKDFPNFSLYRYEWIRKYTERSQDLSGITQQDSNKKTHKNLLIPEPKLPKSN
jgi:hypothetical protein